MVVWKAVLLPLRKENKIIIQKCEKSGLKRTTRRRVAVGWPAAWTLVFNFIAA